MILIPDIHISAKYGDKILQHLSDLFAKHPDEKEVLFLGDYVYMFSYDRAYLLRLFALFVELVREGRQVKVMSGNHDWIQGHFVFAEGKQAFDLIQTSETKGLKGEEAKMTNDGRPGTMNGSLEFITQTTHRVDDNNNLHVIIPYNDHLKLPNQSEYFDNQCVDGTDRYEILQTIKMLEDSTKPGEILSGTLNRTILGYYETARHKVNQIIFYHHYYTAQTQFPGVKAVFAFRDGAVHPGILDIGDICMISGHIHEPFQFKNYLCCGSFWHTSNLETNECKYYFVGEADQGFQAHMIHINPKITLHIESGGVNGLPEDVTQEIIEKNIQDCLLNSQSNISGSMVGAVYACDLNFSDVDLILKTAGSTQNIAIDDQLIQQFHTSQIQHIMPNENPKEFTSVIQSDYRSSFSDRKSLLDEYLLFKYPAQHATLVDFLEKHAII